MREAATDYEKRIKRYSSFEITEVKAASGDPQSVKSKEGAAILKALGTRDTVVALSELGKYFDSRGFSAFLEKRLSSSPGRVVFVLGGAFGLGNEVLERADFTVSLSKMTMPHEMARLVVTEQLYRAFTIIKGEPYSH